MSAFVGWFSQSNPSPPAGPLDYIHDSITEYPATCLVGVVALAALTYYACSRASKPSPLSDQGKRRVVPPPNRPPPPIPVENPANCNDLEGAANLEAASSKRVRIDPAADSKKSLIFQVKGEINKLTEDDKIAIVIFILNWWKQQGFITTYDPSKTNVSVDLLGHQMNDSIEFTEKDVLPADAKGIFSITPSLSNDPTFTIEAKNKLLAHLFLEQLNSILGIEPRHYKEQEKFSARWSSEGYLSIRKKPEQRKTRLPVPSFMKH